MNFFKKLAGKIKHHAPLMANLLQGTAAGEVMGIVTNLLGVKNEDEAVKALEAKPELLLQLKQYEMDHKIKLEELQLEATKAYLADVQSARGREIEMTKTTGKRDLTMIGLTWITIIGFFAILGIIIFVPVPKGTQPLLYILLGVLGTNCTNIYGFYFGSSQGSQDKTAMMNNQSLIKGKDEKNESAG